jgi:hypothetical protein
MKKAQTIANSGRPVNIGFLHIIPFIIPLMFLVPPRRSMAIARIFPVSESVNLASNPAVPTKPGLPPATRPLAPAEIFYALAA